MEPPVDLLQGTEMSGGRPAEQLEGESDSVQQTKEACQLNQSSRFFSYSDFSQLHSNNCSESDFNSLRF